MENIKILTIMRGISGSGKSFMAKLLSEKTGGLICSTDDFFIQDGGGVYKFDVHRLGINHQKNQQKANDAMKAGTPNVIIDNTNCTRREMKFYVDAAKEHGYVVQYVTVTCDVEICIKRNSHNVPADTIRAMAARFHHENVLPEALVIA